MSSNYSSNLEVIECPAFFNITAGVPIKDCAAYGNNVKLCPESLFGVLLCQEIVFVYEHPHPHPHELTNLCLETTYGGNFNVLLHNFCNNKLYKYDKKKLHNLLN